MKKYPPMVYTGLVWHKSLQWPLLAHFTYFCLSSASRVHTGGHRLGIKPYAVPFTLSERSIRLCFYRRVALVRQPAIADNYKMVSIKTNVHFNRHRK